MHLDQYCLALGVAQYLRILAPHLPATVSSDRTIPFPPQ
jgi:hypothetical protein